MAGTKSSKKSAKATKPSTRKGKGKVQDPLEDDAMVQDTRIEVVEEEAESQAQPIQVDEPASADAERDAEDQTLVSKVADAAAAFVEEAIGTEALTEQEAKLSMEERKAKLDKLRQKLKTSTLANRASLLEENAKAKVTARDTARLEKQRRLAETLRAQAKAAEEGADADRSKNWEWTVEENDQWEKKLARKKRRADYEFHDDAHAARRRYKKDLDDIKPDLAAYNKQKELAFGLAPGSLSSGASSSALTAFNPSDAGPSSQEQQLAHQSLYRDANTLLYADNKPSEDAIDRVVGKINKDIDKKGKFSRKRLNEDEGDITYINERNRVFNKKIARYYDKYTSEIRASFERGTAL